MKILEKMWPYLMIASMAILIFGCTQGELEDATGAVVDAGSEHGPEVINDFSTGDYVGGAVAAVCLVATAIGGYIARRKKKRKKNENKNS